MPENRNGADIANGGDLLAPGDYTPGEFGMTLSNRKTILWIEGVGATTNISDNIRLEVDPDGPNGPAQFQLFDDTRVTVVERTPQNLNATVSPDGASVALTWTGAVNDLTRAVDVYASTSADFTPSSATMVGVVFAPADTND